jgi:hypothetical protein
MATYTKFQPFVEAICEKKINLAGTSLTVALCNAANPPVVGNGTLSQLTQIAYTNLSSRVLTVDSHAQSGGTFKLVLADLVLTASGSVAPFRYVVIYDDLATNDDLIAFWDRGSEVTLENGDTLTLDFDPTNGVLQLA